MQPASALICGLIRNPQMMLHQLTKLKEFRSEKLVDQIVMSTWPGELARYPEVSAALGALDAVVIESREPILRTPGHVIHQAKCLSLGLYACSSDAMVLKLRPDSMPLTDDYRRVLSGEALEEHRKHARPYLFERPVWVHDGVLFWPFYINDITFFGSHSDLRTLADIDFKIELYYNQVVPEQFFHMTPVLRRHALMRAFARVQRTMIAGDGNGNAAFAEAVLESPLLLKAWVLFAKILVDHYYVGFSNTPDDEATLAQFGTASLADLVRATGTLPGVAFHPFAQAAVYSSNAWAQAVLQQRFRRDAAAERLAEALATVDQIDSDIDNPVFPHPEVLAAVARLQNVYVQDGAKICHDPADQRLRSVPDGRERVSMLVNTDEVRQLRDELTHARRQIQSLSTQLNEPKN